MKKRFLTKAVSIAAATVMALATLSGCGENVINPDNGGGDRPIDYTKLQLWVYNMGNATGSAWLDSLIKDFEEEYKETEFPNGTKGVQVTADGLRAKLDLTTTQPYHIVFTENESPADIYGDLYYSLDDVVKGTIPGESKTIEGKLSADLKAGLTARGKYYSLPHFEMFSHPTYNRHLFDEKGLYFADSVTELYAEGTTLTPGDAKYGILLKNKTAKKSCGPDGLYNTDDDGLPSSIEEFKQLTTCMTEISVTPFVAYASTYHYTNKLLLSMWATLEGANGVKLYQSDDSARYGTTEIIELDADGKIIYGTNGPPKTVTYTPAAYGRDSQGYMIERQASKYYALDMMNHIFSKSHIDAYYDTDGLSTTTSHTEVQGRFLESEVSPKSDVAFLIDGTYWENEAKDSGNLAHLNEVDPDYYTEKMDYRVFSLPTQYLGRVNAVGEADEAGNVTYYTGKSAADVKKQVLMNVLDSVMYVNKTAMLGIDGEINESVEEAVGLFIKYMYSDENMSKATAITGMTRALDYDIQPADREQMTAFSRNLLQLRNKSDVIMAISDSAKYVNNTKSFSFNFQTPENLFTSFKDGDQILWPINGFRHNDMSLDEYFEGIARNRNSAWWGKLVF